VGMDDSRRELLVEAVNLLQRPAIPVEVVRVQRHTDMRGADAVQQPLEKVWALVFML